MRCHRAGLHGYNRASFVCDATGPVYMVTTELRLCAMSQARFTWLQKNFVCDATGPVSMVTTELRLCATEQVLLPWSYQEGLARGHDATPSCDSAASDFAYSCMPSCQYLLVLSSCMSRAVWTIPTTRCGPVGSSSSHSRILG